MVVESWVPKRHHSDPTQVDYAAPEYLIGQAPTNRSDIYFLGVVAYEMLSGHHPYGKGFSTRRQIEKCKYIPAARHNSDIPVWFDGALQKATCCDPARRYGTLSEFIGDLSRPNRKFIPTDATPLMERDPLGFWKGVSFILFIIVLILLYALSA